MTSTSSSVEESSTSLFTGTPGVSTAGEHSSTCNGAAAATAVVDNDDIEDEDGEDC